MISTKGRIAGATCAVLAASAFAASSVTAADAMPLRTGAPYGGFTSSASATPLRIEVYEPAIPVPASPQGELNLAYTNVSGASGPDSTARSSMFWPGATVGEGLPTLLGTFGLPPNLFGGQYPVQANAQYPGTPNNAAQSYLPGMVETASGSATQAVARAGWSTSGQVGGDPSAPGAAANALSGLQAGSLGGIAGALNGPTTNTNSNPLGLFSALVGVGGMSSSAVTDYSDPVTVSATGTSQIGEIDLLGGIVKLEGMTVTSTSSSSLDGGGKTTGTVVNGSMTIAGQAFQFTNNGFVAAGNATPLPGLPSDPTAALAALGISIQFPQPTQTSSGPQASGTAQGPILTIDTQPLITMLNLPTSPLSNLINQLPSSAGQAKSTLLGLLQAHPKFALLLGNTSSAVTTIAPIKFNLGGAGTGAGSSADSGVPSTAGTGIGAAPVATAPLPATVTTPIKKASAPGLPPLGGVPGLLALLGLALAIGAAWFFRTLALGALGAAGTCVHGLATGLPDLRKA